jgi:hypothetical protein
MSIAELAAVNLLSPPILCFALGVFATFLRSDLKLPEAVAAALSIYLMLAIGLKGGVALAESPFASLIVPVMAAFALGCAIPLWCFGILRFFTKLSVADAAALAAHYGSVSAVTFAAVTSLLDSQNIRYEGYMPAILATMEIPAIAIAIGLARVSALAGSAHQMARGGIAVLGTSPTPSTGNTSTVLAEVLSSKSIVLLAGGMLIGMAAGPQGVKAVKPLFVDLFPGMLCLFLLDLGRVTAGRIGDFKKVGVRLAAFAVIIPVLHAVLGIAIARMIGMSEGGAIVMGTLAASASYIAAPAAVRLALPEANPGYYLTCSLAITFPFNIVVGLPLYAAFARLIYG